MPRFVYPLSRALIASVFLLNGFAKFYSWEPALQYMREHGVPAPSALLFISAPTEIVFGFMLLIGWHTRFAALALAAYLLPVTFYMHDFWNAVGTEQVLQQLHFLKNFGVMGGLLAVAAQVRVPVSLDEPIPVTPERRSGFDDRRARMA